MLAGGRRSPGDPAFAAVVGLLVLGLLYGAAEFARQAWWKPSPPGIPGDSGGDPLAHLALGLTAIALPGVIAWFLLRRVPPWLSRLRWLLTALVALLPTSVLVMDSLAELRRWTWTGYEIGGLPYYVRLVAIGLAVAFVPAVLFAVRRPGRWLPRPLGALALLVIAAAPFGLVVRMSPAEGGAVGGPLPGADAPCVLLITVDTLRQDALAPYGGPVELPVAMREARALDGWSVSSWTRPSMASLFTALVPTGHGADRAHVQASTSPWWPEQWQRAGWNTAAVATNPFLRRRFDFDRGFTHFEHSEELRWLEPVARTFWAEWWQRRAVDRGEPDRADRRAARAEQWLAQADRSRPWLLWIHLMDPHLPYHLRGSEGAPRVEERPAWVSPLSDVLDRDRFTDLRGAREGRVVTTAEQRAALQRLYHTEVDFALHWLADLVEAAAEAAGDREFVWMLSSDHGEEFWDDGGFEHGHSLHDTVLRVPLLVGGSGMPRLGVDAGTRLRLHDVGPLLSSRLGPGSFEVRASSGLLEAASPLDRYGLGAVPTSGRPLPLLAEGLLYGPPRTLLVAPGGDAIERQDEAGALRVHRRWSLEADPPDTSRVRELRALLLELDLWRERNAGRGEVVEFDPELERRLRAVGYLD